MADEEEPVAWLRVQGELRRVAREDEIVEIARGLAADRGDPSPVLIEHAQCSRATANRVGCHAAVAGERDSYLIAVQGRFELPSRRPRGEEGDAVPAPPEVSSVMTLVVDVATGAPTDSGYSNEYPDLALAGRVITDYRAS